MLINKDKFGESCKICRDNYTCSADCCGIVPIRLDIYDKYKLLAEDNIVEIIQLKGTQYVITKDMKCVFLNKQTNLCMIYEDRPNVCKFYGLIGDLQCPYIKSNGNLRNPNQVKKMLRIMNHNVDNFMKVYEKSHKRV